MSTRRRRPWLGAPGGLAAETFRLGGHDYAILEWAGRRPSRTGCLSRAEGAVLELLLLGLSNAEVARRRRRSAHTVAHQVDSIFRKLGVGSRLELFAALSRDDGVPGSAVGRGAVEEP